MTTQQQLIDQAKNYVITGGALAVWMPNDAPEDRPDGMSIEVMYLDARWLRYAWLDDDRCHLHEVAKIEAGDDGAVLVHAVGSNGMVLAITRATQVQVERLTLWKKRVASGEAYSTDLEGGMEGVVVFGQQAEAVTD